MAKMTLIQFDCLRIGVNKATTQSCFCDFHDNVVFADIEKPLDGFDKNDEKQIFIFAYKTFIFEYYKDLVAIKLFQHQLKLSHQVSKNDK